MIFWRSNCKTLRTLLFTRDVVYIITHQLLALGLGAVFFSSNSVANFARSAVI